MNEVPLGDIGYVEFIELVAEKNLRPERPDNEDAPDLSDEIWELATKCWVKDARQRPTAKAVANDVSQIMETNQVAAAAHPQAPYTSPLSVVTPASNSPITCNDIDLILPISTTNTGVFIPRLAVDNVARLDSVEATPSSKQPAMILRSHAYPVYCVAFSPDGSRILSGGQDYAVRLWNAETGDEVLVPMMHETTVSAVAFSPDGTRIASGDTSGGINIWDVKAGIKSGDPLKGHIDTLYIIAFSRDGHYIASGSADRKIIVWDIRTGKIRSTLIGHSATVCCIAFSPDGNRIVSGASDQTVRFWNSQTGRPLFGPLTHNSNVYFVSFSPDFTKVVSGDRTGEFCVWDAETGASILAPSTNYLQGSLAVQLPPVSGYISVSPDGRWIARTMPPDKTITIWDSATGHFSKFTGHAGTVWCLAFSSDGKRLASCSSDTTIQVFNWPYIL